MKRKDWLIVLAPLFLVWLIDRLTKLWAFKIGSQFFLGPIGFGFYQNGGAMLGLFSDLPPVLRIVSLSTGGTFLIFSFAIIQYLLPIKSLLLRSGMSVLLGGIIGNVTDRIIWGYVVDFIILGSRSNPSPAFNLADAFQWVGYGMLVVALVRENDLLWPRNNVRRMYWINPKFQLKYCITLMGVGAAFSLIAGVFSYTFLRVTIIQMVGAHSRMLDQFLLPYVFTFTVVSITFCAMLFAFGRVLSHRIAGPLYAFERYLKDILAGHNRTLKMRAGDEFRELEELARQIAQELEHRPRAHKSASPDR